VDKGRDGCLTQEVERANAQVKTHSALNIKEQKGKQSHIPSRVRNTKPSARLWENGHLALWLKSKHAQHSPLGGQFCNVQANLKHMWILTQKIHL
jgi:hypothetical protein